MRKLYIATAITAFLIALVTQFPAKIAWQWLADDAAANGVFISNPDGTAFNGSAGGITLTGLTIESPRWQAQYWPLLIAQLRLQFNARFDGYPLVSTIKIKPTGSLSLRDMEAAARLSTLAPLFQLPLMPLNGLLVADMKKVKIENEHLSQLRGRAVIKNAEWIMMRPALPLGNLQADISTRDELITAELSSEGQLLIRGTATLNAEGRYEADIQLRGNSGADPRLGNLLKTLGQANDGWYRIKTQGQLPGY